MGCPRGRLDHPRLASLTPVGLQISRRGVQVPAEAEIAAWRARFDDRHGILVPGLVEPRLLEWMRGRLATAPFREDVHDTDPPAVDLLMDDAALHHTLMALFNDARLFDVVERISSCDPIGCYMARVYAMDASPNHHDEWHSDVDGNRMIGMSVNLAGPYEGGLLRIREGERVVHEVANTGSGDAILFRIRPGLQHIVTPVTGPRRKMALAGWFQRTPAALARLREHAAR